MYPRFSLYYFYDVYGVLFGDYAKLHYYSFYKIKKDIQRMPSKLNQFTFNNIKSEYLTVMIITYLSI